MGAEVLVSARYGFGPRGSHEKASADESSKAEAGSLQVTAPRTEDNIQNVPTEE